MSKSAKLFAVILSLILIWLLTSGVPFSAAEAERTALHKQHHWWRTFLASFNIQAKTVAANLELLPLDQPGEPPLAPEPPPIVKGVYYTGWMAGSPAAMAQIVNFANQTEVNALVVDVKDDTGTISYLSTVPLARQIGANRDKFDPKKVVNLLNQNHIYPIARIVVFKDPLLSKQRAELSVRSTQGGLWHDNLGLSWVDPYNKTIWDYNIAIAKEAAAMGFKEIQFDYVRFTSDGMIKYCLYPNADSRLKADVIRDFLKYAYQELNPLGVKVSADVFGLTCSAQDDLGIGQQFEKLVEGIDIICPMVYPSHYRKGEYGISNPDRYPYETVLKSLTDAKLKLAKLSLKQPVIIRAWLQDFSLQSHYGREQLLAQIKAVEDAGFQEWIFWNPTNKYNTQNYRPEKPLAELVVPTTAGAIVTPNPDNNKSE